MWYRGTVMKKLKEIYDMYDMILANMIAGTSIIEPSGNMDGKSLAVGFSNIASKNTISKYFMVSSLPDYLEQRTLQQIRKSCAYGSTRVDFIINSEPYKINWDSAEMKSRMRIWEQFSDETRAMNSSVFNYRQSYKQKEANRRIINSTKYLNEMDTRYERKMLKACIIIRVTGDRTENGLRELSQTIKNIKSLKARYKIQVTEIRINMLDWLKRITPFSLESNKEIDKFISKKLLTDDIYANMMSYRQGRIGDDGIPIGMDLFEGGPAMHKFKKSSDSVENWGIVADSDGGKSLLAKSWLPYFSACGYTVLITDYEGDEYTNYGKFVRSGNKEDVKMVAVGKSGIGFANPCAIGELTGDDDIDAELKNQAVQDTMTFFRIIVAGPDKDMTMEEKRVVTTAIERVYDYNGVTDSYDTWKNSSTICPSDIYNEIKRMVDRKELVSEYDNNLMHMSALRVKNATSIYLDKTSPMSKIFDKPINISELHEAKLVIFSFGMRGQANSTSDPTLLALKQLSVSIISTQIANYSKYVKHTFTVLLWDEFQRWIETDGAIEIIANHITGGRKRGDINIIISNDISAFITDNNIKLNKVMDNINNFAVGNINKKSLRHSFCDARDFSECKSILDKIAKDSGKKSGKRFAKAFCIMLGDGTRAVIKAMIPSSILKSKLYSTGVQVE